MKPIEAMMFALVKRFAPEFVPGSMQGEFDAAVKEAQQTLAREISIANWVEKKTARMNTWQGVLEPTLLDNEIWAVVSTAIFAEQNLEITYLGEKGEMRHEVRPLAVVKRDAVLYVALQFSGYGDARLLPLHRIVHAVAVKASAGCDVKPSNLENLLTNGLPFILPGERAFDMHLLLDESTFRTIQGRPLCNTTAISTPVDGWFEVKATGISNTVELRWWLLGLGDKVRILEPESLARELQYLLFDPLTKLVTRQACHEHFERMIAAACRTGSSLAVAMVDIDHFKMINDDLGHSAGDKALQEVSRRLKSACRTMDVVGRWGGEEFLILLPETAIEDAALLAERLRQAVASTPCLVDDKGTSRNVSVSIGVTALGNLAPETKPSSGLVDLLLKEADSALYAAKERRNCVELFKG